MAPFKVFARAAASLSLMALFYAPVTVRADDFDVVVRNVRPAGVKSFKLAVFEEVTRAGDVSGLGEAVGRSLGPQWRPLIRVRTGRGSEQTHVYVREAGDNLKVMIVTLDGEQATVIRAKVNPEGLARFARDPKLLGISLQ